ncbi:putative oxygen-independent coproporphyrinogen III oxidase [Clostridium sp. CAG:567]|jgi:oxygen-independent coproporphyrinogen-3 oxidase|nr:putative oxygen-independent coproporphyrinogen III oxidase [Clostridium sp. CAG:567]
MRRKQIGLYIHIPFCKQKCSYCDFCSYANKESFIKRYIQCVLKEIIEVGNNNKIDFENGKDDLFLVKTIYIGGGTPSLIDSKYIVQIIEDIKLNFEIDEKAEITIEVNPGTVTLEKLEDYKRAGINRLSIGLQSTHEHLLKEIGRIHTYLDFLDTFRFAREAGFENINVDLMIGIPNQTLEEVKDSIEEIVSMEPEHISVYSLILEEGTPLFKKVEEGLELPDEELERKMYWNVKRILEANGYNHYEISNFAKQGYESKHNLDCWNQKEYIGFGIAAHSYTNGIRYSNIENIEQYIKNYDEDKTEENLVFHEKQDMEAMQKEYMLLGLRKIDGVSIQEFKIKFVANPVFLYHSELEKLVNEELLEIDGDQIKLTNKGLDLANIVWEEFI